MAPGIVCDRAALQAEFEVQVEPDREIGRVVPVGELDIATSATLYGSVADLVAAGFAHVLIDLRKLVFIDCCGIRLLLSLDAAARRDGWCFSLIQGPAVIRRVFALTGTYDTLPFASTAELARTDG
jgi:anti-anti-sigma factor